MSKYWSLFLVLILSGCSGSSTPLEGEARVAYETYRSKKGFCGGPVGAFRKVNGAEKTPGGMKFYAIEFEAEENTRSCWTNFWQTKGDKLLIGGEIYFLKTENGWKPAIIECGEKTDGRWIVTGFCRSEL